MCYTRTIKSENVNEKNYVRALYFKNITLGPLSLAASTLIYAKLIQDLMNLVSCWKPFFNYPKKSFFRLNTNKTGRQITRKRFHPKYSPTSS